MSEIKDEDIFEEEKTVSRILNDNEMNEQKILSYDPFAGDFEGGGARDVILKNKMVTARKNAICCICEDTILPKDRIRIIVEIYDDELLTFKFCTKCCKIMEEDEVDEKLDERRNKYRFR